MMAAYLVYPKSRNMMAVYLVYPRSRNIISKEDDKRF